MRRNEGIHQAYGTQKLILPDRHSHTMSTVARSQVAAPNARAA